MIAIASGGNPMAAMHNRPRSSDRRELFSVCDLDSLLACGGARRDGGLRWGVDVEDGEAKPVGKEPDVGPKERVDEVGERQQRASIRVTGVGVEPMSSQLLAARFSRKKRRQLLKSTIKTLKPQLTLEGAWPILSLDPHEANEGSQKARTMS
ncbi:hypothetical protein Drorol1_Dr00020562 [Drosera rotundifolia]